MTDYNARFEELYSKYIRDIRDAVPEVMAWDDRLLDAEKYNSDDGPIYSDVWPSGFGSHPRFIGVFRRYFIEIEQLIVERDALEDSEAVSADSEDAWGGDDDEEEGISSPNQLLLEQMQEDDPDLFEYFDAFFLIPVGYDDHVATTPTEVGDE